MRFLGAVLMLSVGLGLAVGCGGSGDSAEDVSVDRTHPGYSKYIFYCAPCHGKSGKGARHLFPPLHGETWANLDPDIPVSIVLKGLEGRLVMEGGEYMNQMAPLEKRMTDREIADVLTFVRSSFGNTAPAVTPEQVAAIRERYRGRDSRWKVEEIQARVAELENP